jgi:hypothetical protein
MRFAASPNREGEAMAQDPGGLPRDEWRKHYVDTLGTTINIRGLPRDEWRKRYVDTLGTTISYFLTLSTATIAFCAAQISQPHGANELRAYQIAAGLLGVSVAFGIVCSIVRLFIFRERGNGPQKLPVQESVFGLVVLQVLRVQKWVFELVVLQVLFFFFGIVTVAIRVFACP